MVRKSSKALRADWNDEYYVASYKMARSGMSNDEIAKALGVPTIIYKKWLESKNKAALQKALEDAREGVVTGRGLVPSLKNYLDEHLPDECRDLWKELTLVDREDWDSRQKAILAIEQSPERIQQRLFLRALEHCNYSMTDACRVLGLSKSRVDFWISKDINFAKMLAETVEGMKFFGQSCLIERMRDGDTACTIFFMKTKCKDWGYGDKGIDLNINGQIDHNVNINVINTDDILRVATQEEKIVLLSVLERLEELRAGEKKVLSLPKSEIVDAEFAQAGNNRVPEVLEKQE